MTAMTGVLGIDLGRKGGLALLESRQDGLYLSLFRMPKSLQELAECLETAAVYVNLIAVESPLLVATNGRKTIFSLARQLGQVEGIAAALGAEVELISPQKWQKWQGWESLLGFPLTLPKEEKSNKSSYQKRKERKKRSLAAAEVLFKDFVAGGYQLDLLAEDGPAEAFLIAFYSFCSNFPEKAGDKIKLTDITY